MAIFLTPKTNRMLLLISGIVCGVISRGAGQSGLVNNPEKLGDQYFSAKQYFRAAQYYQAALRGDSTNYSAAYKLAESFRFQLDYAQALHWYRLVYRSSASSSLEAGYYQALMLKNLGRCGEAIPLLEDILNSIQPVPQVDRVKAEELILGCQELSLDRQASDGITIIKLDEPVNSTYYDYAPVLLGNDSSLSITSTRFAGKQKLSYRFGENNANIFTFKRQNEVWSSTSELAKVINTRSSEGSGSYSKQRKEYYFSYCPTDEPCKILYTRQSNGKWSSVKPLSASINLVEYTAKHPAISATGDTLFFVSDRPGGQGGLDIWLSLRLAQDQWATPICLDTLVNTIGDEVTPYYSSQENLLVFASNGHKGYGSMDLFLVKDYSQSADRFRSHLPVPINSSADDSYLILGDEDGYLASNRHSNFDIYTFTRPTDQAWLDYLLRLVPTLTFSENSTGIYQDSYIKPDLTFSRQINDWVTVQTVKQKRLAGGATRFVLNSDVSDIRFQQYQQRRLQEPIQNPYSIEKFNDRNAKEIEEVLLASFSTEAADDNRSSIVKGTLRKGNESVPFAEQVLELRDKEDKLLKVTTTNSEGAFRFVNVEPNSTYSLVLGDVAPIDSIVLSELAIEENKEYNFTQNYEPIYFDFNQEKLRPEAKKTMEMLAELYRQNPDISIEINAYADSLGNAEYNYLLSQKRGEAAFRYLIDQGVDRAALVINAKGVSTAYTSTNSFVSQQLNRRVEFTIYGLESALNNEIVTRIPRPKVDLATLLQYTNMTVEELHNLNGRPVDEIQPFKPLRVVNSTNSISRQLFYEIVDIN